MFNSQAASILLTIAIPSWNRARFLEGTLAQLRHEWTADLAEAVEVLVSDNCSPDDTRAVVAGSVRDGLPVRYVRNEENLGSDRNIAQCFNLARGQYVLILGDDDLPVDGALQELLEILERENFGVVCVRTYGFNHDFRREHPGGGGRFERFADAGRFLQRIGPQMTLISACAINKSLLPEIDANEFEGENLVQTHLVVLAALRGSCSLYVEKYLVACLRNNTGGYDFSKVFVHNLFALLAAHKKDGLSDAAIRGIAHHMLLSFYPFQMSKIRRQHPERSLSTIQYFNERFRAMPLYWLWVYPILAWPRLPALIWGTGTTLLGRILNGELRRGLHFARNLIRG